MNDDYMRMLLRFLREYLVNNLMIINELKSKVARPIYSKIIEIDDEGDGECTYVFPDTKNFLKSAENKRNTEKLYKILSRPEISS